MELPIWQRSSCSFGSPCIAEAIHWSQPSHRIQKWIFWKFGVCAFFSICKSYLDFSSVTNLKLLQCPCCQPTTYHWFVDILSRYDLFWWFVPEKCIWAKRPWSTALRAVMVHSVLSIALAALISFIGCCATKCKRENKLLSWINCSIEISPSMRWFFALLVSRMQVAFSIEPSQNLLCLTILDIISTCCAYVLSLQRACLQPLHVAQNSVLPPQVPQHFDRAPRKSQYYCPGPIGLSSRHPPRPVDLISFTSYGTDQRMQESEQNCSRNRGFLNFCLVGPQTPHVTLLVPKHNSRFWVYRSRICWSWWSLIFMKHLVEINS